MGKGMSKINNYLVKLNLDRNNIIKRLENLENFKIRFEKILNDKTTILFVTRSFNNFMASGVTTVMLVIESKDEENLCEVTITVHNPIFHEGLLNDLNVAKNIRNQILKEFEPYTLSIKEIKN